MACPQNGTVVLKVRSQSSHEGAAASSTPFPISGMTRSSSFDHRVVCIYDYAGWANVMVSRASSHKAVQIRTSKRAHEVLLTETST